MSDFKTSLMTRAINAVQSIDNIGWGRTGAAAGAAIGSGIGMVSDDTSILGGGVKGAIAGAGLGRLARFGSQFIKDGRSAAALDQFSNSGVSTAQGEVANNFGGFGGWNTKFRATAVGEFI